MNHLSSLVSRLSSLKVTCVLLVAFLLLIFWGVLGQSAAGNEGAAVATDRFFGSYFLWAMGVVLLPAMKSLAIAGAVHLVCSLIYRMPRIFLRGESGALIPAGWRNLGLWGMHIALILLLVGGVIGSEFRQEYNGFRAAPVASESANVAGNAKISFFAMDDSLNAHVVEIPEGYPYYVFYKGQVDMFGTAVDMYTATYDPFKFVPYVFSVLFLLSAVFHYIVKARGTKKVRAGPATKLPNVIPALLIVFAGIVCVSPANADDYYWDDVVEEEEKPYLWHPEDPVLVDGQLRPFDSFARGVLDAFSGRVTCKHNGLKYSAIHTVYFIQHYPHPHSDVLDFRLFKVLRSDVQKALNLPENERYVSYNELNAYRSQLELYASRKDDHPATLEMQRLLSNVQLFEAIQREDYKKADATPEQVKKFGTEVFYNSANFALIAFIIAFLGCILASINSIFKKRGLDVAANISCGGAAAVLTIAFALRFYIAARPPLSSLYEIVLLVALLLEAFEFGAFIFCKKRTFTLMIPVTLMAAVLLFFAKFILEPGDLFQPIPAVLNSSVFLTLHVFTIALGFAGVILSGVVAHVVLWRARSAESFPTDFFQTDSIKSTFSLMKGTLVFGSIFTILGTLLGGVWADYAWGRFWGFDPKECGALFVILWTMLGLHLRAARLVTDRGFVIFNSFNVIVTFLCWFGVNLLGVGLHSYGFQSGTMMWLGSFVAIDTLVIAFFAIKRNA